MSDSTSILDLPTDPLGGGNITNNITVSAQESQTSKLQQPEPGQGQGQDEVYLI